MYNRVKFVLSKKNNSKDFFINSKRLYKGGINLKTRNFCTVFQKPPNPNNPNDFVLIAMLCGAFYATLKNKWW
jgi:hypothetical protein